MLRNFFKQTRQHYGITGKAISELTGISQNHISEYQNGKRDVTSDTLWRMIEAMDNIAPGSRKHFGNLITGIIFDRIIEDLEDQQLGEFVVRASDELARRLIEKSRKNTLAGDQIKVKAR